MAWILDKIFKKNKSPTIKSESIESGRSFSSFNGNSYESDIFRSAVDTIARNCAKLKPTHIVTIQGQRKDGDNTLNRILQIRPNPYMSTYDLLYKLVTHYLIHNNAFACLERDSRGYLKGIYPLNPLNMEYVIDGLGGLYCKFTFINNKIVILPFGDVFTIRRFFNSNELLGDSNTAVYDTIQLSQIQNEGLHNSIKAGANIKGILKYNQILSPSKLKEEKEVFMNDYFNINNNGGIAVIDSKAEYIPLNNSPTMIDEPQINAVKKKIYSYFGISENIIDSSYSEQEWSAFYESVIEPISVQISLELTEKLFTEREKAFGNSIMLEANRLQFASATTKITALKELMPLGLLTINQGLEILNLPSISDGDKRIQTLNVVNAEKADEYQLGEEL